MIDTQKVGGILRNEIALKQNPPHVSSIKCNSSTKRQAPRVFTNEQGGFSSLIYKPVEWAIVLQYFPPTWGELSSFFLIF